MIAKIPRPAAADPGGAEPTTSAKLAVGVGLGGAMKDTVLWVALVAASGAGLSEGSALKREAVPA